MNTFSPLIIAPGMVAQFTYGCYLIIVAVFEENDEVLS